MRFGKIVILLSFIIVLSLFAAISFSLKFRSFSIDAQDVEAFPGETIIVNGTVLNTGLWWLHNFNLTVSNLPFSYKISPAYLEELRIYREWNPDVGVYKIPEKFFIVIDVPNNASGIYRVNVTGQEHQSFYKISNSTEFVLRIIALPNISLSEIIVPEDMTVEKLFGLSVIVNNSGIGIIDANISVKVPEGWNISETMKSFKSEPNTSTLVSFAVTPSNESGEITAVLYYKFKDRIINITKSTSMLIPIVPVLELPEIPEVVEKPTGYLVLITDLLKNPIVLGIVIVVIVIIIWYIALLVGKRRKKKSKGTTNVTPV